MAKVKTSELIGPALNWAVGVAQGKNITLMRNDDGSLFPQPVWADGLWQLDYCTSWAQGGPIIEREVTKIFRNVGGTWSAMILKDVSIAPEDRGTSLALTHRAQWNGAGPTPLIAAMRCFVLSKLGPVVEVPDELT